MTKFTPAELKDASAADIREKLGDALAGYKKLLQEVINDSPQTKIKDWHIYADKVADLLITDLWVKVGKDHLCLLIDEILKALIKDEKGYTYSFWSNETRTNEMELITTKEIPTHPMGWEIKFFFDTKAMKCVICVNPLATRSNK